jgi:hypothetical protein
MNYWIIGFIIMFAGLGFMQFHYYFIGGILFIVGGANSSVGFHY